MSRPNPAEESAHQPWKGVTAHSPAGGGAWLLRAAVLAAISQASVALAQADPVEGFVLSGVDTVDYSGVSVSSAGDINGDGIDDIVIGAWGADPGGDRKGAAYVVFGRSTGYPEEFQLRTLMPENGGDGSEGFVVAGVDDLDRLAREVTVAGDVNGDGIDDLLVGALRAAPDGVRNAGEAYVVFGRSTGFPAVFELADLLPENGADGSEGILFEGIRQQDATGRTVADAGDVNGDGLADILIGAIDATVGAKPYAGASYLVFGSRDPFPLRFELGDLASGDGSAGFVMEGVDLADRAGLVSGAGDINNDGIDDIAVGAWRADPDGQESAGETYIIYGRTEGFVPRLPLAVLLPENGGDGSLGFVIDGINASDQAALVDDGGDLNGDGIDDLIIGAWRASPNGITAAGQTFVLYGRDSNFPARVELSDLLAANGGDGSAGFVVNGIAPVDRSGIASSAGDFNADGIDDLIIGAFQADPQGRDLAGEGYVLFGRSEGFPAEYPLAALRSENGGDGSQGVVIDGIFAEDRMGRAVAEAGDLNGDGFEDVILGAWRASPGARTWAGQSYVLFGRDTPFPVRVTLGTLLPLRLTAFGQCPGTLNLEGSGLTPLDRYAVLQSETVGDAPVPVGPCAGTPSNLGDPTLLLSGGVQANGVITHMLEADEPLCGTRLQLLDTATCELSPVVTLPSPMGAKGIGTASAARGAQEQAAEQPQP